MERGFAAAKREREIETVVYLYRAADKIMLRQVMLFLRAFSFI